jgi:DNA-binding CsgD family transcriptional regulator
MFIVDGIARIIHINASGYALLTDAAILRCVSGRLSVFDRQAQCTLRAAIAAARADDAPVDMRGVTVPLTAYDGKQWLAHVLPLTRHARRHTNTAYTAVAAVFIRKVGLDLTYALATLASVYNLTPAEMRVFAAIVEFGGVPEVAPVLGISETTVKTHLQHIFEKTGTNRQADLVKLVAGFESPLR